jgi:hypothetical protein
VSLASARKMPALPVDAAEVSDSVSLARFGRFQPTRSMAIAMSQYNSSWIGNSLRNRT